MFYELKRQIEKVTKIPLKEQCLVGPGNEVLLDTCDDFDNILTLSSSIHVKLH